VYYALFPVGVFCECWIFWSVARHVWLVFAVPMVLMVIVHVVGMFPWCRKGEFTVVAGIDVFVVKTGDIFRDPKVRAWIPVADGSHAF
jgi:hypothetical protein